MNAHAKVKDEVTIALAQRALADRWATSQTLQGMALLRAFVDAVTPVVPLVNRRYELASEALASTARPQDWKTIRKLLMYFRHITADTHKRIAGTALDRSSVMLRLKALPPEEQSVLVQELLAGSLPVEQERWRQFIGIWSHNAIYREAPTRQNMTTARERLMRRHRDATRKIDRAKEGNTLVGRDVQHGIRRLVRTWAEVPPLARLMFLQELERQESEREGEEVEPGDPA